MEIQARVERLVKGDAASKRMDRQGFSRSIGQIAAKSRETAYAYMWNPPGKLAERMDGFVTRLCLGTGNISISYRAHSRSYTMGALRYSKGLGQAARLKRELVGIGPGHRKLSKVFFREIIQHEQHSLAIFRSNYE